MNILFTKQASELKEYVHKILFVACMFLSMLLFLVNIILIVCFTILDIIDETNGHVSSVVLSGPPPMYTNSCFTCQCSKQKSFQSIMKLRDYKHEIIN